MKLINTPLSILSVGFSCDWALVACLEKPKGVDLPHKVGHARPSPQSKSNHQNKSGHKSTDTEESEPVMEEQLGWLPH